MWDVFAEEQQENIISSLPWTFKHYWILRLFIPNIFHPEIWQKGIVCQCFTFSVQVQETLNYPSCINWIDQLNSVCHFWPLCTFFFLLFYLNISTFNYLRPKHLGLSRGLTIVMHLILKVPTLFLSALLPIFLKSGITEKYQNINWRHHHHRFCFCFVFVFFCQSSWRKSAIHSQNSTIYWGCMD